jgi:hypothetical protein
MYAESSGLADAEAAVSDAESLTAAWLSLIVCARSETRAPEAKKTSRPIVITLRGIRMLKGFSFND